MDNNEIYIYSKSIHKQHKKAHKQHIYVDKQYKYLDLKTRGDLFVISFYIFAFF